MTENLWRKVNAELIGTYALVTAGCGAIMVNSQTGALKHVGVAATFGLIITVMIAATGHISGAHFNPAVTVAFALNRHFKWRDVPFYIGGQLLGAVLATLTVRLLIGDVASLGATLPSGSVGQSFGIEILLSAVLMFVIIAVATDTRAVGETAAIAIGATVALDALWGGPISGASMNPARSLGPALIAGVWQDQWIYIVGPLIGGFIYEMIRRPEPSIQTSVQ
jgi:aquaporin NIP